MNGARGYRQRWLLALLGAASSSTGAQACNSRFEFDEPSAGSGGLAGASAGAGGTTAGAAGLLNTGGGCGVHAQCLSNLHCVAGECYECAEDLDCKNAGVARCDETHRCVACLVAADCPDGFACDSIANRCLPTCQEKADCPVGAHGCDDDRHVCYECDEDRECATSSLGTRCASDGSGCVQCRGDADCPGQVCDPQAGRCVECRDWRDCASGLCNPALGVCSDLE